MPLVAYEILEVVGKALTKLGEQLKDGELSNKESAELFQTILTELLKEYYD